MRKLFVLGGGSHAEYGDELAAARALVIGANGDTSIVSLDALTVDTLIDQRIDVVISNGLPTHWYYTLRGLNVVSVTLDAVDHFAPLADVVIDYRSRASTKYFTGPAYSLRSSVAFQHEFCEIVELVKKLEWDSAFWGVSVGYLSCRYLTGAIIVRVEQFVKEHQIDLIEYLCNCHDDRSVTMAEQNGFHFTDIRLSYELQLGKETSGGDCEHSDDFTLDRTRHEDIPRLQVLSSNLYLDSRYFFDQHFDRKRANLFYQTWVEKGVLGTYDDECFCFRENGIPISFCTVKYHDAKTAQIGLVGIAVPYQGKGLGVRMLQQVFSKLTQHGYGSVFVVTQGRNYGAQRLYQKMGFRTKSVELWYHKWK